MDTLDSSIALNSPFLEVVLVIRFKVVCCLLRPPNYFCSADVRGNPLNLLTSVSSLNCEEAILCGMISWKDYYYQQMDFIAFARSSRAEL